MSKRGLPTTIRMRHDAHYVEELATHRPMPIGRLIALDLLDPNPDQPRVEVGDLDDLTASIRETGVLEPLLVKPVRGTGRWLIIAGERRWRASKAAGLRELPCIEMDVDDKAVAEIALIENMQRKDLTPWEESDGLLALCERFGYTHEEAARKVGKSRSSVTEALSIAMLPPVIREKCRHADISAKSLLLQVVRQPDIESMHVIIGEIAARGLNRDGARAVRRAKQSEGRRESSSPSPVQIPFVYEFESLELGFRLQLSYGRSDVELSDVVKGVREVLKDLEARIGARPFGQVD